MRTAWSALAARSSWRKRRTTACFYPRRRSSKRRAACIGRKCVGRWASSNGRRCGASPTGWTRITKCDLSLMHVVERFAAWAADWRSQPISKEVAHHARRAVIDWHAALLPGLIVPPATMLKKALPANDARTTALINGSAAHTVEVDDIYRDGIYHPGAPTIAAAHALGFQQPNFLRSVVV